MKDVKVKVLAEGKILYEATFKAESFKQVASLCEILSDVVELESRREGFEPVDHYKEYKQ